MLVIFTIVFSFKINNMNYTDSYTTLELYNTISIDSEVNIQDKDIILEFTDEIPEYLIDYTVIKSQNAKNIDEVCIFKVKEDKTAEMKEIVQEYILKLRESYLTMNYFPEEEEKIDYATVRVYGNYVFYSFLSEYDTNLLYRNVKKALKK